MIVRILGEGRYEVPDADLPAIEQLDAQLVDAMDRGDETEFRSTLADLIAHVRHTGTLLKPDDLRTSSLVVPHAGIDPGRGAVPAGGRSLRPLRSGRALVRPARQVDELGELTVVENRIGARHDAVGGQLGLLPLVVA